MNMLTVPSRLADLKTYQPALQAKNDTQKDPCSRWRQAWKQISKKKPRYNEAV